MLALIVVFAALQDPPAPIPPDLFSDDENRRAKALSDIKTLEAKQRKALASSLQRSGQDTTKKLEAIKQKAVKEMMAKRPDATVLKKRIQDVRALLSKLPEWVEEPSGELHEDALAKLKELWTDQYPDLNTFVTQDDYVSGYRRLKMIRGAVEACGEKSVIDLLKREDEALRIDEHQQWKLLLSNRYAAALAKNEDTYRKAKGDMAIKECEYRCSIRINMFLALFGTQPVLLDASLCAKSRKQAADEADTTGRKDRLPGDLSVIIVPGAEDGEDAAWQLFIQNGRDFAKILNWGALGLGQSGRWWFMRG